MGSFSPGYQPQRQICHRFGRGEQEDILTRKPEFFGDKLVGLLDQPRQLEAGVTTFHCGDCVRILFLVADDVSHGRQADTDGVWAIGEGLSEREGLEQVLGLGACRMGLWVRSGTRGGEFRFPRLARGSGACG